MARARNIKPSFFQNEELGELSPLTRLAFIGMWTIADFKGCIEFRPKRLKVQLMPYDDCNFEQIANDLDKSGLIAIYSVRGQRYIKIINFEKHQNPHKNERESGSDIPDITEKDNEINDLSKDGNNRDKNGTDRADSLNPLPDSLIPSSDSTSLPASGTAPKKKIESDSSQTWKAYSDAYFARYGTDPVRNASVNAKMAQFVGRLGRDEAPHVAKFFVGHNNGYYVREMHAVGAMLKDAEKLRTEWATNTRMTNAKAVQADKTQTNLDAFAPLIAAAKAKEEAERKANAE
jgi:hypothetical protein